MYRVLSATGISVGVDRLAQFCVGNDLMGVVQEFIKGNNSSWFMITHQKLGSQGYANFIFILPIPVWLIEFLSILNQGEGQLIFV